MVSIGVLRNIDSNYVAGHFGKWGMGSNPETLGLTKAMDLKCRWRLCQQRYPMEPPLEKTLKIRQVTQRAEAFLDSCAKEKRPFFLQVSHYAVQQHRIDRFIFGHHEISANWREAQHVGFAAMTRILTKAWVISWTNLKNYT